MAFSFRFFYCSHNVQFYRSVFTTPLESQVKGQIAVIFPTFLSPVLSKHIVCHFPSSIVRMSMDGDRNGYPLLSPVLLLCWISPSEIPPEICPWFSPISTSPAPKNSPYKFQSWMLLSPLPQFPTLPLCSTALLPRLHKALNPIFSLNTSDNTSSATSLRKLLGGPTDLAVSSAFLGSRWSFLFSGSYFCFLAMASCPQISGCVFVAFGKASKWPETQEIHKERSNSGPWHLSFTYNASTERWSSQGESRDILEAALHQSEPLVLLARMGLNRVEPLGALQMSETPPPNSSLLSTLPNLVEIQFWSANQSSNLGVEQKT